VWTVWRVWRVYEDRNSSELMRRVHLILPGGGGFRSALR
jgi:hypothetical protein